MGSSAERWTTVGGRAKRGETHAELAQVSGDGSGVAGIFFLALA